MRGTAPLVLNPNRIRIALITVLLLVSLTPVCAQSPDAMVALENRPTVSSQSPNPTVEMRIQRARALAAAHQLQPAINELEGVRRSSSDDVVRNVTSVMLMGIYLEEGNYIRAQALLDEDFRARSTGRDAALRTYFAIAGQAINGARSHLARYRSFGINISDPNLPAEAIQDLDRLRSLTEKMAAQAKEIASERKGYDSLALLEDVIGIRLSLARDAEDRATWESEYATAREGLASSQTQIASLEVPSLAGNTQPAAVPATKEPPTETKEPTAASPAPMSQSSAGTTSTTESPTASSGTTDEENEKPNPASLVTTGSLNARAIKRSLPVYPPVAKASGISGTVRVSVVIDESGKVSEITGSEGPVLLRAAAEQAARAWRFAPTAVNGKPVRLAGYIEFNFIR